ncbi:Eph receptor B1, partial [Paragonimus westermani]
WRSQSRAGSGQLVYGVCEVRRAENQLSDQIKTTVSTEPIGFTSKASQMSALRQNDQYWLFSPLFSTHQTLSMHVELKFQIQKCSSDASPGKSNQCLQHFSLMIRQSHHPISSYQLEEFKVHEHIFADNLRSDALYPEIDFFRHYTTQFRVTAEWFQVALQDHGACVLIDRVVIFHLSCAEVEVSDSTNLLRLPQTHTGHYAEVRSIEGHCVPGAMPMTQGQDRLLGPLLNSPIPGDQHSINAFCMANGKWHLNADAQCSCQPGHEKQSQVEICRGLPSVPRNLNAVRINGTAVVLTWDKPIRTGGFNTTEFRIGCQGCIPDRVRYTPGNVLNGTK